MFRKKQPEEPVVEREEGSRLPLKERKLGAFRPELAKPARSSRPEGGKSDMAPEAKTLLIGREINLKGEIGDCDSLMVHGNAEATLNNCRSFVITESGVLKGEAEVQEAEVFGRYEGTLKVRGKLIIRTGGRVQGRISYADIEIEQGGRIDGEIDAIETELVPARAAS